MAIASGGEPANVRLAYTEPSAYAREAASIAPTERTTTQFMTIGSHPTSTATPTIPSTTPTTFLAVRSSPIHTAATTAVNITVVEFRMAAREAVRFITAALMREKGIATFTIPSSANCLQRTRSF